ncbi:hypothetical protein MH117_12560 [Paenibacillus sp. ACRRX]|uniref:hypothetical protein n=1 Tax=unclassified Paenibacillus TaxID=185978 RepID=UPI001EF545E7|nr:MULTISPECIES: hypothetical protein [unclassified Paenibacillus]MCG7408256.1 hypothetical protein [Paenibacillus sp. ACRRX]MDK8181359.1 hypothetical protein [Paenibacillus sp. UMB4589-SE434]
MSKNVILCISILLSLFTTVACKQPEHAEQPPGEAHLLPIQRYGNALHMQEKQNQLYNFIVNKLSGPNGIHTNYRNTGQSAEMATGHEVLSESAGLMMRYYALTGQQDAFDQEWSRAQQSFNLSAGFSYRFSPELQKKYTLNAAVDDLRIIRALYEAGQSFKSEHYVKEGATYGSRFYEHNVKEGYLYDFYDETYHITNDFVTLCYIDLAALRLLPIDAKQQEQLYGNMLGIAKKGYLSDKFPFYETRYQYKTNAYRSENINTVESLITILSLAEVKQHNQASIQYIKNQVKAGTLYGQYTKEGTPTNDIQSTAIYAIAAMLGSELGDKSLYEDSIRRMNQFQIEDGGSPLRGGFGDTASEQAFSFDNLMALLAYAY